MFTMNDIDQNIARTATVTGKVSQKAKERLSALAREHGPDGEEHLVGEAVERLLSDAYWIDEIQRRKAVPRDQRVYVAPDDMQTWVNARTSGRPLPMPEGTSLADL